MSIDKTPALSGPEPRIKSISSNSGSSSGTGSKKSIDSSVIKDVGSDLSGAEADRLARGLGEKVQDSPQQALAAQGSGLDEDTVRKLLED